MIICSQCGTLDDTDLYPEGFYRITETGNFEDEPGEYRCVTCNEEES